MHSYLEQKNGHPVSYVRLPNISKNRDLDGNSKELEYICTLFDRNKLCRYPRPQKVIHDDGGNFVSFNFQEICLSYGITTSPTTVKNARSNSAVKRMHLTAADMLCTMSLEETIGRRNWIFLCNQ